MQGFESLLQDQGYRLKNEFAPARKGHDLHFKQTAYNWLTFCVDQPPAYASDGDIVSQTMYGTVKFSDQEKRNLSLLLANGKFMFVWWIVIGDDFHLTQNGFASAPFGPGQLTSRQQRKILSLLPELESAMTENLVFKLNAGKNIGNYNLARCRHVTDKADRMCLEAVGLSDLWEEVELEHAWVVRTSFGDAKE